MRKAKPEFMIVTFPRTDGAEMGIVRLDAIIAAEPGTKDGNTHLHLSSGAELVVSEPVNVFMPACSKEKATE